MGDSYFMKKFQNKVYIKKNIVLLVSITSLILLRGVNEIRAIEVEKHKPIEFIDYKNTDVVGWCKDNTETWYWFDNKGIKSLNKWENIGGIWYRFDTDGKMLSNRWYKDEDGEWYWLNQNGSMVTYEWKKIDGIWYRFNLNGSMMSNQWYKDEYEVWYWLNEYGMMSSNKWEYIGCLWYRFNSNGSMMSNEWYKDEYEVWYWLKKYGNMAKNEFLKINDIWYRFESSGSMSLDTGFDIAIVNQCDYLNVRSGPSVEYNIVDKLYSNEYLAVLDSQGNWSKVKLGNSNIGWVNSNYITKENVHQNSNELIRDMLDIAYKQLGKPYKWGGNGPDSFDCSGFTSYVYKHGAGVILPRVSREQYTSGRAVDKNQLSEGDLVFFSSDGNMITHVGMYIGNNEFIHSPQQGDVVKISRIDSSYYIRTYAGARRII